MYVNNDDEIYRVDAVWLGPPRATFPWRVTYSSYLTGAAVLIGVLFVQRRVGLSFDVFSVGWALVLTVVATRFLGRRVNHDRPLSHLARAMYLEMRTPRQSRQGSGGALPVRRVRLRRTRPTPRPDRRSRR